MKSSFIQVLRNKPLTTRPKGGVAAGFLLLLFLCIGMSSGFCAEESWDSLLGNTSCSSFFRPFEKNLSNIPHWPPSKRGVPPTELAIKIVECSHRAFTNTSHQSLTEFSGSINGALNLRQTFSEVDNLEALTITDWLNRGIFCSLMERIVRDPKSAIELREAVKILRKRTYNSGTLLRIAKDNNLIREGLPEPVGTEAERFVALSSLIGVSSEQLVGAGVGVISHAETIRKANLNDLICLIYSTEYMIHVILPIAVDFVAQGGNPQQATGSLIRSTVGNTAEVLRKYGSSLVKAPMSFGPEVARMFERVSLGEGFKLLNQ